MEPRLDNPERPSIIWSEYMKYRASLRGYNLGKIGEILRHSGERYIDTVTRRLIAIGKHGGGNVLIPITVHRTTRQQVNFRLKTGRFIYE